jgi:F-type H+-transporting ATPase subunit b
MHIDIAQVLTNIVGFLLVVWVLKRFAWGPILELLDARREKIRNDFAEAERALQDAEGLKSDFNAKLGDIKTIEREKIQEAVKRGEVLADGIVGEARRNADGLREKAQTDIAMETDKAQIALRDTVVNMALGAAEKVIRERLDEEKHRRLILDYIENMGEMPRA